MNTLLTQRVTATDLDVGRWVLAVPVVLYAAVVFPFVYRDVVGEPDLERMALAVIYGASTGLNETANYHYGYLVSFGYYAALYHLLPRSVLLSSAALISAINYIGYASAVATIATLALYTARLFGVLAAFTICMLFGFSPVFLDVGTSGHPQVPGMALLLLGGWLLTFAADEQVRGRQRAGLALAALAVMTAALCVRNDVALAFPFLTLAGPTREISSPRRWLRAAALRLAVLALALVIYVVLEAHVYHDNGSNADFVTTFFATFYKPEGVPRGLVAFVLATGVASMAVLATLVFSPAARRLPRAHVAAIALLALPCLIFWLPNSTPSRHLLLASLAVAMFIGLALTRSARLQHVIAIAVLVPIANQALAEGSHDLLVRNYRWEYPLLTARRATTSIPMGAFPLDHEAKQEAFMLLRDEGRAFARACSGHLLVFAEQPHYMMLSLVESDRTVRFDSAWEGDTIVMHASGKRCTVDFVVKQAVLHRDALRDFLNIDRYKALPIYFQEARRNPYDRMAVPADRRFCIDSPVDRTCHA